MSFPVRSAAVPWIAGIAMLALTLFAPGVLNDGDTFSHIAAGDWMIAHRGVPYTDPFSFSDAGAPWVAHEWLAEILMAAAFGAAGWAGVVGLTALAAALAFFQLGRHLTRWVASGPALLMLLLAGACIVPGLLARPHILALPVFEAWVAGLAIARGRGRAPPWRLLPLMVLWANLHGGFIIGLLLIVPFAGEALLAERARWQAVAAGWGGFLVAATIAAMLTPHGVTGLIFPFQLAGMSELARIGEWRPADFSTIEPVELVLLVGLYVALTRGARLPVLRLLVILGLLHMALVHTRHQMLIGMIVPLLIAEPLGAAVPAGDRGRHAGWWSGAGLALAVGLLLVRALIPIVRVDGPSAPITALANVPPALRGEPVLNDYGFGGYLIFAHVRPFIDGRADMYGPAFLQRYEAITRPDRPALEATLRDYRIRWTLLAAADPAVSVLDGLPGWCRLHADDVAVVHVRSDTGDCP
jgi:hypothetical protein